MDIFPIDWRAGDVDDRYVITVFGKTPDAQLVAAHITFYPYFYVNVAGMGAGQIKSFIAEACAQHNALQKYSKLVERMSLWGFTNQTKTYMVQLAFATLKQMKWAARKYRDLKMVTYESSMDPLLRFFHIRDIAPVQWIRVASYTAVTNNPTTRAPTEVNTSFERVGPSSLSHRPPLIFCSFDLETYSASRRFPSPENEEDCIIQIASSFQRYGELAPYRKLILGFKDTDQVDGVEVVSFEEEGDMVNAWCNELAKENVDVLVGYNIDQVTSAQRN